ncbi:abscisate beta-glucosyltransferase-like [Abrus precatorius]|uniref:Glycosyltransferase n=1 Tax=Abrus precatorius TaxID=3816 RepID=A0A8B8KTP5_ABRPR|nr:abscisate beta-glucosyltransferase-like [Abrus precatorius]
MDSKTCSVKMLFFPFVGGGHQIPMIDTARVFASHGATSIILTTPSHALNFQKSITRDQHSGLPITIHTLSADITDTDMSATPMIDTSVLLEPLKQFLLQHPPDCIVIDMFHRWAGDIVDELQITRIVFTGNGCFARCVHENIRRHVVLENLTSDFDPFIVPNLPDRIEMTRSQLPVFLRNPSEFPDRMKQLEDKSFGTVINSFYDLEPAYADYIRNDLGKKAWIVGPVSLCNRTEADKTERGKAPTVDEQKCLNWLNSKKPNSVLYVSFGSLARLPLEQLNEIAYGLEASEQSFIWVVGKISNRSEEENGSWNWLPEGFEQRMKERDNGLILRGWAPQLLILEHAAIGGFMTHCGWNSTLEGVSSGVPMITWPLSAEQFSNEKLVTKVLGIGVQVGSREWVSWNTEWKEFVGRDKVELAVKKLMVESEQVREMRRRVKDIAGKAKRAVEKGGTSYGDAESLIQELKARRLARQV